MNTAHFSMSESRSPRTFRDREPNAGSYPYGGASGRNTWRCEVRIEYLRGRSKTWGIKGHRNLRVEFSSTRSAASAEDSNRTEGIGGDLLVGGEPCPPEYGRVVLYGDSYALWLEGGFLRGVAGGVLLSALFSPVRGRWHHLAYTYTFDVGAEQQVLYVDGIPVASDSANSPIVYVAQPLLLGCGSTNGLLDSFLHGRIDEAAIYNLR